MPSLAIEPVPSKFLFFFTVFIAIGAIICVIFTPIFLLIKLTLIMVVIINLFHVLKQHYYQRGKKSIRKLMSTENKNWLLEFMNGDIAAAELLLNSVVTRRIILLNFKLLDSRKKYSIILFPDSECESRLRQLRSLLAFPAVDN